jgi:hypothetical protein
VRRLVIPLAVLLAIVGATPVASQEMVSLIRVIGAPENFDGKLITVVGVPRIEFEGNALYLHREDFDQRLSKNALWLSVPKDKFKEWKALEGKYVLVEGVFSAKNTGHFGMFSGSLGKITRFQVLRPGVPK